MPRRSSRLVLHTNVGSSSIFIHFMSSMYPTLGWSLGSPSEKNEYRSSITHIFTSIISVILYALKCSKMRAESLEVLSELTYGVNEIKKFDSYQMLKYTFC